MYNYDRGNRMNILAYPICALFIIIFVNIIFFSKERLNTNETKIYSRLIVANLIENIFAFICLVIVRYVGDTLFYKYLVKIDYIMLLIWGAYFFRYTTVIAIENENIIKKIKIVSVIVNIIVSILVLILPVEVKYNADMIDTYGPSMSLLMVTLCIYLLSIIFLVVKLFFNKKFKTHRKKLIPMFILLIMMGMLIGIKLIAPEYVVQGFALSFVSLVMYFTIENPDLKTINALNEARISAEKANRAKSDFLSSMSHEIRTPLNAIVGLSEDILKFKDEVPNDVKEDSEDIINASQTLIEIIGNILDINKIESEKMQIVSLPYNFKEAIDSLARIQATRIGDKPVSFKVDIAEDIPDELIGDKVHVKEIVSNLLSNAIKYTDRGEVEFSVKCINKDDTCMLIICVRDTGRGIKAENITRLFDKFERLDIERNTTTEGTGLGLAITKHLIDMMGGKINVQSTFGKGSLFVAQIPQKISKEPTITLPIDKDEGLILKRINGKKILIVDDNRLNIKVAIKALSGMDVIIDTAMSGKECLEKVKNGDEYDLILMDIMMPEMDGSTTLDNLRKLDNFNIPVIALTADALSDSEEKYLSEGFVSYLAKPFSKEQIKEKLRDIFRG